MSITASGCSPNELKTEYCRMPQSIQTCVSSYSLVQPNSTEDLRTWLQQASHASHSAWQESNKPKTTPETCGLKPQRLFAEYDLEPFTVRMCQDFFGTPISPEQFSPTLPQWGIMSGGEFWELTMWGQTTAESASGFWPTPTVQDSKNNAAPSQWNRNSDPLNVAVLKWPTPRTKGMCGGTGNWEALKRNTTIEEARQMGAGNGGVLNPTWVEWLMGWPVGWTDLEPLEMDKFHSWQQQHSGYLTE